MPNGLRFLADVIRNMYSSSYNAGEFAADAMIAYDHLKQMNEAGDKLVNTFGSGAGRDIDNYYHPLLQCRLAQISENSGKNGLMLGEWKEVADYYRKKYLQNKSEEEIIRDSTKDLQNNVNGHIMGKNNPYISCLELLDDKRTENMRKLGIR